MESNNLHVVRYLKAKGDNEEVFLIQTMDEVVADGVSRMESGNIEGNPYNIGYAKTREECDEIIERFRDRLSDSIQN